MAHRAVLTARQRAALFHLPTDEALILRHYALSDEDIDFIRTRRRPENLIGFALQLCALRYPGRLLRPGEIIPKEMSDFIAAQLGVKPDDLLGVGSGSVQNRAVRPNCGSEVELRPLFR